MIHPHPQTRLIEGVEHVGAVPHQLPAPVLELGRVEGAVQPGQQHGWG